MSCAELVAGSRINGRASYPHWACGLSKLSALNRWRLNGLSALNRWRLCVESVALLIKSLYFPVINTPVVGASPFVHNPVGLHTNRLALATDNLLKS
jgi:hypothetical protein